MDHSWLVLLFVAGLALSFGFSNGFNDSSSLVATAISSRALSPETALTLAAAGNFFGAYCLGTNVARTVGKGIVDPEMMRTHELGVVVLASALFGALSWNAVTWYFGIPSSSSHA